MTTTTNLHAMVKDYDAKVKAMRDELSNEFKKQFKVISGEIFAKYPDIIKFGWTQYTPYFNDGEPCVFGYYGLQFCTDPDLADDDLNEWEGLWGDNLKKYSELADFEKVLSASTDILLAMFGDHVKVTVTPAGMDVEEYEHD